ncbi:hypothetical protein LZ31DRAFT_561118 [Colletotrichum somersetense]|nr:hypothetical protein LZ31DRAFT_561118 [Colletotrichum somersetense]
MQMIRSCNLLTAAPKDTPACGRTQIIDFGSSGSMLRAIGTTHNQCDRHKTKRQANPSTAQATAQANPSTTQVNTSTDRKKTSMMRRARIPTTSRTFTPKTHRCTTSLLKTSQEVKPRCRMNLQVDSLQKVRLWMTPKQKRRTMKERKMMNQARPQQDLPKRITLSTTDRSDRSVNKWKLQKCHTCCTPQSTHSKRKGER